MDLKQRWKEAIAKQKREHHKTGKRALKVLHGWHMLGVYISFALIFCIQWMGVCEFSVLSVITVVSAMENIIIENVGLGQEK